MSQLGRLSQPFPVEFCANVDCLHDGESLALLDDSVGAYLFRDFNTGKLVVFCGDCCAEVELNARDRFMLIAL